MVSADMLDPRVYYEFPPGSLVTPRPNRPPLVPPFVYRVEGYAQDAWLQIGAVHREFHTTARWDEVIRVCRNCHMVKEDHVKGKCLYAPTSWEP